MASNFAPRKFKSLAFWLACFFLLALIVFLNLPLLELPQRLGQSDLASAALAHKRVIAAVVGVVAIAVLGWVVVRRNFVALTACAFAFVFVVVAYGTYKFQKHYPRADLFSISRYRDNLAILLGKDVLLSKYDPVSTLKVERKTVTRAAFPAIDVHFHLESLPPTITPERLVKAMDAAGIAKLVNLGGVPGMFEHFAETFYAKYPDRFIMFVKPDPNALSNGSGIPAQVEWIKKAARMGARGIKENKSFGLGQRDETGKLVAIDDPRMDPIWELAGKLGMPVLVHTGEPPSFFLPVDAHNERYQELLENPDWSLYGTDAPSQKELMEQRERLLARHPKTNFIGAHLGMNPDDLAYASYLLDKYPNYYVDMSSVISELGREPYSARRFFIKYQDRILFGTDGGFGLDPDKNWTPERMYSSYFDFLETDDEYMEFPLADITKQGNWRVYGIQLPSDVLEKIYVRNAERLIPSNADINAKLATLSSAGN